MRYSIPLLLFMATTSLGLFPAQQKQLDMKITIEGRNEHPIVCMTRQDITRARTNRDKYPWAKKAAETLLAEADEWANKSDEDIIKLVPPPKSCYAYGFTCPICGGTLASWWGMGGVCSIEDPGDIKCVNGHRLPDDAHAGANNGYVDKTGRKFLFVGTGNSYIIDILTHATTRLVHAYALTGDEKYAHKAAIILDNRATVIQIRK